MGLIFRGHRKHAPPPRLGSTLPCLVRSALWGASFNKLTLVDVVIVVAVRGGGGGVPFAVAWDSSSSQISTNASPTSCCSFHPNRGHREGRKGWGWGRVTQTPPGIMASPKHRDMLALGSAPSTFTYAKDRVEAQHDLPAASRWTPSASGSRSPQRNQRGWRACLAPPRSPADRILVV